MTIDIVEETTLSDNWCMLKRYRFRKNGTQKSGDMHTREVYDRGNGAGILLFDPERCEFVLTKQFRLPCYLNEHDGMLIEVAAGVLDGDDPEGCAARECEEETGYRPGQLEKVCDIFTSPGSVTERLHLFYAEVRSAQRLSDGGGVEEEGEDIEVLHLHPETARNMVETGEICDAKTMILIQWFMMNKWKAHELPGT